MNKMNEWPVPVHTSATFQGKEAGLTPLSETKDWLRAPTLSFMHEASLLQVVSVKSSSREVGLF